LSNTNVAMKYIATLVFETGGRRKHVLKLIKLYNAHKGMPMRYILTDNTDIVLYGYCRLIGKTRLMHRYKRWRCGQCLRQC